MSRKNKKKKRYAKGGGKLKLSAEEWAGQTDINSFPKVKKIEIKLVEKKKESEEEQ